MVKKKYIFFVCLFVILAIAGIIFFISNSKSESFSVKTFLLRSNIPLGGESVYKIKIENKEDISRNFKLNLNNLEELVEINESNFIIDANGEKEISLFVKDDKLEVKLYSGELIISNELSVKKIPVVITVENDKNILSIIHSEIPQYYNVYPGGNLGLDIKIYDLNDFPVPSISAKSHIQNINGEVLWTNEQDLIIDGSKTEIVDIPKNWPDGTYVFVTLIEYEGIKSISTYVFEISKKNYMFLRDFNLKIILLIGLVFLLVFIILIFHLIKSRDEFLIALKKQQSQEISKNIKFIRSSKSKIKSSKRSGLDKRKELRKLSKAKKKIIHKIKRKQISQRKKFKVLRKKNKKKEIKNKLQSWKNQGYKMFEAGEELGKSKNLGKEIDMLRKKGYKI